MAVTEDGGWRLAPTSGLQRSSEKPERLMEAQRGEAVASEESADLEVSPEQL